MLRSRLQQSSYSVKFKANSLPVTAVCTIAATVSACTYYLLRPPAAAETSGNNSGTGNKAPLLGIIDTDLMDKIADKPYLNYRHRQSGPSIKAPSGSNISKQGTVLFDRNKMTTVARPDGVPESLRVLVIDVPEFRRVFDEECHVDLSKIFPDGVAHPKIVKKDLPNDDKSLDIDVIQKSLVKSLSRCGRQSKTILLEASVSNLNPRQMKRRYKFNVKHPRSGQQQSSNQQQPPPPQNPVGEDDDEASPVDGGDEASPVDLATTDKISQMRRHATTWVEAAREEEDAPWNQKAWMEEMDLRINGRVPFTDSMEPSSNLSRFVFGNHYRSSIPTSASFLRRCIPFLSSSAFSSTSPDDGVDGTSVSRASQKPHAVLADGAAMHSVPGSLLHLTRSCRDANVPLYVVNDPRSWGHNTHPDFVSASRDLRKTVKHRVVQDALRLLQGSSFERGRRLGRVETQVAYEAKEASDRTKRAFDDARASLSSTIAAVTKSEAVVEEDWSGYEGKRLREELVKRKVVAVVVDNDDVKKDGSSSSTEADIVTFIPSKGMLEVFNILHVDTETSVGDSSDKASNNKTG